MKIKQWRKPILSGGLIVGMVFLWIFFMPIQLGGQVAYVIVDGNSMQPDFDIGDLVLTRPSPNYGVGDAVVYKHPDNYFIFHRIVQEYSDIFILQGDNNSWFDAHEPNTDEIVGELWVHIPKLGNTFKKLREPGIFTIIITISVVAMFVNVKDVNPNKLPPKKRFAMKQSKTPIINEKMQETIFLLSILILASMLLGWIAFSRPVTIPSEENINIQHNGTFNYSAKAEPNIYEGSGVETGDPIYRNLSDRIEVSFEYIVSSMALQDFEGTYSLTYEIREQQGWKNTFTLIPETPLTGTIAEFSGEVLFSKVQLFTNQFLTHSQSNSGLFEVKIIPIITIQGSKNGVPITDIFSPALTFSFTDIMVTPISDFEADQYHPIESFSQPVPLMVENKIDIFSWDLPVSNARNIAIIGLVISLLWTAGYLYNNNLIGQKGEAAFIAHHYENMISVVTKKPTTKSMVSVRSFDDLMKLAERNFTVIQHFENKKNHIYYIRLAEESYFYQVDQIIEKEND